MKYAKPEIAMRSTAVETVQGSVIKEGWVAEALSPYLYVTSPAYEADE